MRARLVTIYERRRRQLKRGCGLRSSVVRGSGGLVEAAGSISIRGQRSGEVSAEAGKGFVKGKL